MTRAVFLDFETLAPADLDLTPIQSLPLSWELHHHSTPQQISERLVGMELVVTNKAVLDRRLLQNNPQLKGVFIAATGTNNVDLAAARELGVPVCNVSGYSTPSVVQHCFALLLSLSTRLQDYHAAVRRGEWQRSRNFCLLNYPISELQGKTLGIVGYGTLGQGVAEIAKAFGMRILVSQRPGGSTQPGRMPLDDLLQQADVVSLHCPLTEATKNLIGERELGLMKSSAILLNTARGGLVDEAALALALGRGEIAGAGIDVLAEEPPAGDNPLLATELPNLLLTPHSAWSSRESRQRLLNELGANIQALLAGNPRNRVA